MTGRIFRAVALTAALAVLLAAALTAAALFNVYEDSVAAELRTEAEYIRHALAQQADELAFLEDFTPRGRVTLIAPDGSVLYESSADSSGMDNHLGRPEVEQAFRNGWGGSERRSDPLSEVTIYCAVRTEAGNVLRLSSTRSSMLGVFLRALPPLGELAEVTIDLPTLAAQPVLPNAAVQRVGGQTGVWQWTQGALQFTPVTLGVADLDGHVQVLSGLSVGDQVVLYSEKPLTARSRIHVVERLTKAAP